MCHCSSGGCGTLSDFDLFSSGAVTLRKLSPESTLFVGLLSVIICGIDVSISNHFYKWIYMPLVDPGG